MGSRKEGERKMICLRCGIMFSIKKKVETRFSLCEACLFDLVSEENSGVSNEILLDEQALDVGS